VNSSSKFVAYVHVAVAVKVHDNDAVKVNVNADGKRRIRRMAGQSAS